MSRSCYTDDYADAELALWCGAVRAAIRGRRGQAFLREMIDALDALPEKKLAADTLMDGPNVCAMGAVALRRGLDLEDIDDYDPEDVAWCFGIAPALAQEIAYENDEAMPSTETDEHRWQRMRRWAVSNIQPKEQE